MKAPLSSEPLVSVIMSVYNGERYLAAALKSIIVQDYENLEVLVIDDGSVDDTAKILKSQSDPRLRIFKNENRNGLAKSLNRALDLARGKYLARMDADDLSHPERIGRQVRFMEVNPEVGLLGAACRIIDSDGSAGSVVTHPEYDDEIRIKLLFTNSFSHPSMMIRAEVLKSHSLQYNETWPAAQDYEFWTRCMHYCRGANLQIPLLDYRFHNSSVSATKKNTQCYWALKVSIREATPFLPAHYSEDMIGAITRSLVSKPDANDPPAARTRIALLEVIRRFMKAGSLKSEAHRENNTFAVRLVLQDAQFMRPLSSASFVLFWKCCWLSLRTTAVCSLTLLQSKLRRTIGAKSFPN